MQPEDKFPQQNAPEKNTDNAFVQVGADGSPEFPGRDNSNNELNEKVPASKDGQKPDEQNL